jgi:hypothetical protein
LWDFLAVKRNDRGDNASALRVSAFQGGHGYLLNHDSGHRAGGAGNGV